MKNERTFSFPLFNFQKTLNVYVICSGVASLQYVLGRFRNWCVF